MSLFCALPASRLKLSLQVFGEVGTSGNNVVVHGRNLVSNLLLDGGNKEQRE